MFQDFRSFCLSLALVSSLSAFPVVCQITGVLSVPVWDQHPLQALSCCGTKFCFRIAKFRAVPVGTADGLGCGIGFGAWSWLAGLWEVGCEVFGLF